MPRAASTTEAETMKARNWNRASRKGPLKVTVHPESYHLLARLAAETQRAPEDVIHLALSCFVGAMCHYKHTPPTRPTPKRGGSTPATVGATVRAILAKSATKKGY
jgi:hypothetical protein